MASHIPFFNHSTSTIGFEEGIGNDASFGSGLPAWGFRDCGGSGLRV